MHGSPRHRPSNLLLRALSASELERLWPRLTEVDLPIKTFVANEGQPVQSMNFVEAGTVSMISMMRDGAQVEVGLVGNEGVTGLAAFLGAPTSPLGAMVQVEGSALRLPASSLPAALADAPTLSRLLLRYVDSFHSQVSQSAACNSRHDIEHRLARWILMTDDRVAGEAFAMTHEFMATMLGVQRPGVSLALAPLKKAGLVDYQKGMMHVLDRPGLEHVACECYEASRKRFDWLTAPAAAKNL
jgi:CRP-like cAMP-binding protein